MKDQYNLNYPNSNICKDMTRLINQVWKLLPMRENKEDWLKQLDSVLLELRGLHQLFGEQLDFLILISKLEGLKDEQNFMSYRVGVFSSISLMTELSHLINGKS